MTYFYIIFFSLLYILTSLKINFLLASKNVSSINETKSTINDDEEDPVYLMAGGDQPAQHSLAKYVVSISYKTTSTSQYFGAKHICCGAILRRELILTAAYCLIFNGRRIKPSALEVVAGTPQRLVRTNNTQVIKVDTVVVHRQSPLSINDIGLLKLTSKLNLEGSFAQAIPLPQASPIVGTVCTSLGWGQLYMNGPYADEILYVNLTVIDKSTCKQTIPLFTNKEICAADQYNSGRNSCQTDSGGPLICNGAVTGIVSVGRVCGYISGAYTDVFQYIDWITKSKCAKLRTSPWMLWFISFTGTTVFS